MREYIMSDTIEAYKEHDIDMPLYQCTKQVHAVPMTRFEAQLLGLVRDESTINEPGYHVVYSHNYESWSPKAAFDAGYTTISTVSLSFGQAIQHLKQGSKVARSGWNGKGMFLVFVEATDMKKSGFDFKPGTVYANTNVGTCNIDAHIDMYTAQRTFQPGWLASQADMLADDWLVVE